MTWMGAAPRGTSALGLTMDALASWVPVTIVRTELQTDPLGGRKVHVRVETGAFITLLSGAAIEYRWAENRLEGRC